MERNDTEWTGYWERFLQTGSVADYLRYTSSSAEQHVQERDSFRNRAEDGEKE